jgi:hypothetical protein
MPTFVEFEDEVAARIQDGAGKLALPDRARFIRQAITERYSRDRPVEAVADLAGNGTSDLTLPSTPTAFEDGFSVVRELEYPVGSVPENELEAEDWKLYRSPTGLKLRLLSARPTAAETVRLTFTARHKPDGTTVPTANFYAVADYAAALAAGALAALYTQTGDSSIGADAVNYRSKAQEYAALAKQLRARYFEQLGIDPESAPAATGAVIAVGELDADGAGGVDRLTHGRSTR